jgi:hypothetical protein
MSLWSEWAFGHLDRKIIKRIQLFSTLPLLSATPSEWTSFTQLIQELMNGSVRRNLFSHWELDLLLDVQLAKLRKTARTETLRRYLRVVQQSQAHGATEPPRFSEFLAQSAPRKAAAGAE